MMTTETSAPRPPFGISAQIVERDVSAPVGPLPAALNVIELNLDDLERAIVALRSKLEPIAVWRDGAVLRDADPVLKAAPLVDSAQLLARRINSLTSLVCETFEDLAL